MTSYATNEWKCLNCGTTGSVTPAFEQEPPDKCEECDSSEIIYPYHEESSQMEPIPEFDGSIEERIKKLEKLLEVEGSPVRSLLICKKISALIKEGDC